jgi:hypothetical protein
MICHILVVVNVVLLFYVFVKARRIQRQGERLNAALLVVIQRQEEMTEKLWNGRKGR